MRPPVFRNRPDCASLNAARRPSSGVCRPPCGARRDSRQAFGPILDRSGSVFVCVYRQDAPVSTRVSKTRISMIPPSGSTRTLTTKGAFPYFAPSFGERLVAHEERAIGRPAAA